MSASPSRGQRGAARDGPETLRFGVPTGRRIGPAALEFLDSCGLHVRQQSERQLTATVNGLPGVIVTLQRTSDIVRLIADGIVDIGLAGRDFVQEYAPEGADIVTLYPQLGFSSGDVVVAVPDTWVDVTTLADLADVALSMRERGEQLRVGTAYPRLAQRFLHEKGITYFSIVLTEGSVEATPWVGSADLIVELTVSGDSLRENRLKVLRNGVILHSECSLIGNRRALAASARKRELSRRIVELVEARLRAQGHYSVTANMRGGSEREVALSLLASPATRGQRGPTVARVYTAAEDGDADAQWFAATVIVEADALQEAIDHLRAAGGSGMSVVPVRYLFDARSQHFAAALEQLSRSNA